MKRQSGPLGRWLAILVVATVARALVADVGRVEGMLRLVLEGLVLAQIVSGLATARLGSQRGSA